MRPDVFEYTPTAPDLTIWERALELTTAPGLVRIEQVRRGLPAAAFDRFARVSGVSAEALGDAVHVSVRTVQRHKRANKRLPTSVSERLVRLAEVYAQASTVIGDDDLARQWMQTPRDAFAGRTPFEMASSELGAREVEDLLLRIEYGVFP